MFLFADIYLCQSPLNVFSPHLHHQGASGEKRPFRFESPVFDVQLRQNPLLFKRYDVAYLRRRLSGGKSRYRDAVNEYHTVLSASYVILPFHTAFG